MTMPRPLADPPALTHRGLGMPRLRTCARRIIAPMIALLAGTGVLTGCGGGGGSTDNGALIRAVDASTNGGQANVYLNGSNYFGSQNFFGNSFYLNLNSGSDPFTFTLGAESGANYLGVSQTLSSGSYYSVIVLGRADITSAADPRYPRLKVVNDDPTAPPSGQTRVRVILAAPDAPGVDVLIDGQVAVANASYGSVGSYLDLAGGSHSVQINQAGTSTVLVPAQTISPATGLVYSLYVLETAVAPTPTYTVELLGDAR